MFLYRVLVSLFALAMMGQSLRKDGIRAFDRLFPGMPDRGAPHVWVHGASNGELSSLRPILQRLVEARPDLHWLITANTQTGRALVESWALPNSTARLAPLDLGWLTRAVMRRWQVAAHLTLEAELWPHRFRTCPGPVLVLGARMSAGTARGWARLPTLARRTLAHVRFASAQDPGSRARLLSLGLPQAAAGPVVDLKALYQPPDQHPDADLQAAFPRASTWLAASTHAGEEEIVLDAHLAARRADPGLRLILAPRHPRRADEIIALARARGLSVARRSTGDAPDGGDIYLADTMGEMALWYALAGRVFIGGTLCDAGGHTPYEPAAFEAALLHGPDLRNFAPSFARLAEAEAARQVTEADGLAQALTDLAGAEAQSALGTRAQTALRQDTDVAGLTDTILSLLPPCDRDTY
ncbi:3-deoxy-D-manno-octulosonic acid transferase [Pseudoponticoccus marisrubri]|uniref:3-deoxy-D-manno-octulosonic acid transferase n=1 Tax=Pseudoponticoccus marisrubri TaxID=1685382 RepID=A0A0W7WI07_9RHOB|nr:glycosyltransferase N-terminal domain-containing protein [Pseudoponticoccus marisrubri]KUF10234.1 3-deoxy-D-manno-octulosonic acid transferase [Pseudoponticoccus marisrubri]